MGNGGKFEKLISIQTCFYPTMPKISLIFRCPKGLIAALLKFAKMQKSADFCKWREIWKAHINSNMFLPYHAKNQPHFQVSERTYGNFIEICKDKKSAVFLANSGKFEKLISIQTCFYSTLYYSFTFLNKKYPFRQFSAYAPYKTRFSP